MLNAEMAASHMQGLQQQATGLAGKLALLASINTIKSTKPLLAWTLQIMQVRICFQDAQT